MDSAFFNFAERIEISKLDRSDVEAMVLRPMELLRVQLHDSRRIVNRIQRETAGLPNYVQYYCSILLQQLEKKDKTSISVGDLDVVFYDRSFRNFVFETFTRNTELLEQAVAYALVIQDLGHARARTFDLEEIDAILRKDGLTLTYRQLEQSTRHLELAGVLNETGGSEYQFAVPLFTRMLHEKGNVEFAYRKLREQILGRDLLHQESR